MPESRQVTGKSNHHKWLASQKIRSVKELETLPAGTEPRAWCILDYLEEKRGVETGSAK